VKARERGGRNVVGVVDITGRGRAQVVVFYLNPAALQQEALDDLAEFGVRDKMLLDGSNTVNLFVDGAWLIENLRPSPHFFAVFGGRD
jgi:hypothetical protein